MELTPMDLNGDGYVETGAYVAPDGSVPYVQIDTDFDQVADFVASDTNGDGIVDTGTYDPNEDGVPEATGTVPADAGGSGVTIAITGHTYDVYGASGTMVAAENMATPYYQNGGQAIPVDPMPAQNYGSYGTDSNGDGWVDALDPTPTQYGNPSPYGQY